MIFNSFAPGRLEENSRQVIVQLILVIDGRDIFYETAPRWMSIDLGLGGSVAPSGNRSLPELILTKVYVAIWRN